jgi:hypothetical protein
MKKDAVTTLKLRTPILVNGTETKELIFDFGLLKTRHSIEAELFARREFGDATSTAIGLAMAAFAAGAVPNDFLELSLLDGNAVATLFAEAQKK